MPWLLRPGLGKVTITVHWWTTKPLWVTAGIKENSVVAEATLHQGLAAGQLHVEDTFSHIRIHVAALHCRGSYMYVLEQTLVGETLGES